MIRDSNGALLQARLLALLVAGWMAAPATTRGAEDEPAAAAVDDVPGGATPQLRLETGGPTAYVSALAFDPQSEAPEKDTLYVAGWDKVVDVWRAGQGRAARFAHEAPSALRIPIGPQLYGTINALAVSPDGGELAVAGNAVTRGASAWDRPGWLAPRESRTPEMLDDQGTLYLFDTQTGGVRQLRGNRGRVIALIYAVGTVKAGETRRCLVSAAVVERAGPHTQLVIQARDTRTEKLLGESRVPFGQEIRPGLAAWSFGERPEQLAVAICAGQRDERLRLWNVDTQRVFEVADFENNKTVAFWPGRQKLITGSTNQFTLWDVPRAADAAPRREDTRSIQQGGDNLVPHAIVLFASRPNGPLDRLAAIAHSPANALDRLLLMDLAGGSLPRDFSKHELWRNGDQMPVIAASPDGRRLALAGEPTHDVRVYDTSKLLAGQRDYWRQTLRSKSFRFQRASFVRKGNRVGLLLAASPAAGRGDQAQTAGDQLFDPAGPRLTTDLRGWLPSAADTTGWTVDSGVQGTGPSSQTWLRVRRGQQVMPAIWIGRGMQLTAYALAPPTAAVGTPLLAVALHDLGQPELRLYDAATGVFFRQFSGHVERIRSLAFDRSGRLLVSAAEDQTVRVWSMLDVRDSLGTRGSLSGVKVQAAPRGDGEKPRLVVASVEGGRSQTAERLRAGDEILGIVTAGELQSFASAFDLYGAVLEYEPGQTVVLRCTAPGGEQRDVRVTAGQAIDERMPLFSLYAAASAPSAEWIGWAPWGEYESSGHAAEQHIAWHFNTGRPDDPVRVAAASDYGKLRRPGLLQALLQTGKPPGPPPPPPAPQISLRLDPAGQTRPVDGNPNALLVSDSDTRLVVAIDEFDPTLIESVVWNWHDDEKPEQADRPAAREMAPLGASRHDWFADAGELDWRRGPRGLRVTVVSREQPPRHFEAALDVRYSPRPPSVRFEAPSASAERSSRQEFTVRAVAEACSQRHSRFVATLEHLVGNRRRSWKFAGEERLAIEKELSLEPGDNFLRLTASNADAAGGDVAWETSNPVERVISYQPLAPSIVVYAVGAGTQRMLRQRVASENEEPWELDRPAFTLRGAIEAPDNLTVAEWRVGDGEWRKLAGFTPSVKNKASVDEGFDLSPGVQAIECRAKTADSPETTTALTVRYRPSLPEFWIDAPADRFSTADSQITVAGHWSPPDDARPFQAEALHNGIALTDAVRFDRAKNEFSIVAPVERGENVYQLRFWNEWRPEPLRIDRSVVGLRPPRLLAVEAPAETSDPTIELVCLAGSAAGPPVTRLTVNGETVDIAAREPQDDGWRLTARFDRLAQGENRLAIVAWNEDGPSAAIDKTVRLKAPRRDPPRISFQQPADGSAQRQQACRVAFSVRSASEIEEVVLLLNGREVYRADVAKQRHVSPEEFRLSIADVDVTLSANQGNTLTVRAKNAQGLSEKRSVSVAHVSPPTRVVVDEILPARGGPPLRMRRSGNQVRFLEESPTGEVVLKGHVTYAPHDPQLEEEAGVRMRVNSYYQIPATLQKKTVREGQHVREWQAPLYLNARRNEIAIELPGTVKDMRNHLDFELACVDPVDFPRLHLLVVGVGPMSARQMEDDALRAVAGRSAEKPGADFTTPAFKEGHLYGPYVQTSLNRQALQGYLADARTQMEIAAQRPGTDLFMLCYRGGMVVETPAQFYLLTSSRKGAAERPRENGLAGDRLAMMFEDSPGAQLLLLDVERGEPPWEKQSQLPAGDIRYAWLGRTRAPQRAYLLAAFREAVDAAASDGVLSQMSELVAWLQTNIESQTQIPPILRGLVLAQSAPAP